MQNLTPIPRDQRPPLPDFAPVPRKYRHDGWTPERQKAFIEALADTGSVTTASNMVNMSPEGAYQLRRLPGAEQFRRAWEAALDFGVQRLKDEAFERAMNGQLVPVFVAGKLMGFRRKKNDRLLMFCLRHYGHDAGGKRTTINYFSTKAVAGAAATTPTPLPQGEREGPKPKAWEGEGVSAATAEASTTTIRTTLTSPADGATQLQLDDQRAATLNNFTGVELDVEAQAAIESALIACAERRRALAPQDNPARSFIHVGDTPHTYLGELESGATSDNFVPFDEAELSWEGLGEGGENAEIERVLAQMAAERSAKAAEEPAQQPPTATSPERTPRARAAPPRRARS